MCRTHIIIPYLFHFTKKNGISATADLGKSISQIKIKPVWISGLLTAGFADKYDRKKLLLFFYTGFILGTLMCGIVNTYELLVARRRYDRNSKR